MAVLASFPANWNVVFTGRLASMSRVAAVRVVTDQGGTVRDRVSQQTNLLVICADGWPLRKSGSMTHNLRRASELQEAGGSLSIIGEAEFLRRLCGSDEAQPIRRMHTLEQLSRLLGVSGLRLRRWIDLGLVQTHDPSAIVPMFDYQEVAAAKSLARLIARGVSPTKLAGSLRRLKLWLPNDRGLHGSIIALEKQLFVRDGEHFVDPSGQLHFGFDERPLVPVVAELAKDPLPTDSPARSTTQVDDPDVLFDRAFSAEADVRYEDAIDGYMRWLDQFGDDHEVLFNLANIHFQEGRYETAASYYRRCVKENPTYARAWNNLGLCLHQNGDRSSAIESLRRAVDIDPDNLDTLFNLADKLDEAGSEPEARLLWMRIARYPTVGDNEVVAYATERYSELVR